MYASIPGGGEQAHRPRVVEREGLNELEPAIYLAPGRATVVALKDTRGGGDPKAGGDSPVHTTPTNWRPSGSHELKS